MRVGQVVWVIVARPSRSRGQLALSVEERHVVNADSDRICLSLPGGRAVEYRRPHDVYEAVAVAGAALEDLALHLRAGGGAVAVTGKTGDPS